MIDPLLSPRTSDDWRTYTPVLRAKASEWKALARLSPGVRQRITPVLEFVPDWKEPGASTTTRKRRAPQSPEEYAQRFIESCVTVTPNGTRSFVYFGLTSPDGAWHGIDLWHEFDARVSPATGVLALADIASAGLSPALTRVTSAHGTCGLRVGIADVNGALASRIRQALQSLGVTPTRAHVILDVKDETSAFSHDQLRLALGVVEDFASVTVLGGVFPKDLSKYREGIATEPRKEWLTWRSEHCVTPNGARLLSFGDYTVQCAHYEPSIPVAGTVSLRYTTDQDFLVFRGVKSNSVKGVGHDQIHGHCRLLVARKDFDGAFFSEGDQRMQCWTDPTDGPGNAEQWRTAAIVHHITHVVAQVDDPTGVSITARAWARAQPDTPCV